MENTAVKYQNRGADAFALDNGNEGAFKNPDPNYFSSVNGCI